MSKKYDLYNMNEYDRNDETMGNGIEENKNFGKKKNSFKKFTAVALTGFLLGGAVGGTAYGVYAQSQGKILNTTAGTETTLNRTVLQTAASGDTTPIVVQSLDVTGIVEQAMPSIVAITNKSVQEVQNYFSMFGMRGQVLEEEVESQGSGIIIGQNDTELLIATNEHVVADANTLSVCFVDDQAYEATVKGTDSDNDLAVIAVKLSDISEDTMSQIKVATVGNSDDLKVGQQVVAIGNALGYGQSVTTGIVSALNRQIQNNSSEEGFIQTDAAINPGNSGGALLNMNGEVVGINSAKLASTEVEGMGYAIPVSTAAPIMEDLMNIESRDKITDGNTGAIGIMGASVTTEMQQLYGIPAGVYISEITEGGAAESAGLKKGYIISKFDRTSITTIQELKERLEYYAPGETVSITVKVPGEDGYEEQTLEITLGSSDTISEDQNQEQNPEGNWGQNQWNYYNGGSQEKSDV